MGKFFFLPVVLFGLIFSACSTPGVAFAYPGPVSANETSVFIGSSLRYAEAREAAIRNASIKGYTKILAEIIETENMMGSTVVTLIMIK